MAQRIIIKPANLWAYYLQHENDLAKMMYEIAANAQYGIAIYLSENEDHQPCITVEADDAEVYSEGFTVDTAEKTCSEIYDEFLSDKVVEYLSDYPAHAAGDDAEAEEDETLLEQQDLIDDREAELNLAVSDFIAAVLGGDTYIDCSDFDDMIEDCKDHFLEYLARKHELCIYRPMVLEDENGEDFFEEYPYECMEFEDGNNPIYLP